MCCCMMQSGDDADRHSARILMTATSRGLNCHKPSSAKIEANSTPHCRCQCHCRRLPAASSPPVGRLLRVNTCCWASSCVAVCRCVTVCRRVAVCRRVSLCHRVSPCVTVCRRVSLCHRVSPCVAACQRLSCVATQRLLQGRQLLDVNTAAMPAPCKTCPLAHLRSTNSHEAEHSAVLSAV